MREVGVGWSAKKQILGKDVFLGIGERDVAVPVSKFKQEQGRIVLPGASKDAPA